VALTTTLSDQTIIPKLYLDIQNTKTEGTMLEAWRGSKYCICFGTLKAFTNSSEGFERTVG